MQNEESNEVRVAIDEFGEDQNANGDDPEKTNDTSLVVNVVKSQNQESADTNLKSIASGKDEKPDGIQKGCLPRSESFCESCRVCQQQTEEALVELGCQCRGELAKAHRSCIDVWFRTRGSNKCEICLQVTANVPSPESNPGPNYWIWRIDPAPGGSDIGQGNRERRCFSPLWLAFSILIGGLLLDVLISVSLGSSALPVNIIIGFLVVLGLGTALRLALECCHQWSLRAVQRVETNINPGYHPAV